jgi:hypothetical protein
MTVHSLPVQSHNGLWGMLVSEDEYISVLKARHEELDQAIETESARPLPDGLVVQMLKRQKLRIKDKLYRLSAA